MTQPNDPNKIVISLEDTQTARAVSVSHQMQQAEQYALVREVGSAANAPRGGLTAIAVLIMAGSGILGGFFAWGFTRMLSPVFEDDTIPVWVSNITFTFTMAASIGLTLVLIDAATQRNMQKLGMAAAIGVPVSVGASLLFGAIAHFIYSPWTESIYAAAQNAVNLGIITTEAEFADFVTGKLHLARGVAWAIVGISAGVTIGIASRSMKRLLVTTGGGLVGGFLGGFIFDFFTGESSAQFVGIVVTGLLIGLAMSIVEQAAKTRWIEIVSGGMAGKQFILYKNDLTIGSSPRADITLIKDPAIPDLAARLVIQGNRAILDSLHPQVPVAVNGQVAMRTPLVDGSQLSIGSSVIRYRERNSKQQATPTGGPVRLN